MLQLRSPRGDGAKWLGATAGAKRGCPQLQKENLLSFMLGDFCRGQGPAGAEQAGGRVRPCDGQGDLSNPLPKQKLVAAKPVCGCAVTRAVSSQCRETL